MPASVLQIIRDGDIIASVGTPEEVTAACQHAKPGRYVIEESSMAGEVLPSGYLCQRWGVAIRQADGSVTLEPEPAPIKPRSASGYMKPHGRRTLGPSTGS